MFAVSLKDWNHLQPKVRTLWRIEGAMTATILALIGLPFDIIFLRTLKGYPLPVGVTTLIFFALLLVWNLWLAGRSYDLYRYRVGNDDLAVAKGVFWRNRRFISRARIQHVDITAGPIVRALGLVHVSIFVGGQAMAAVSIPGLSAGEGEKLRDALLKTSPAAPPTVTPSDPGVPPVG